MYCNVLHLVAPRCRVARLGSRLHCPVVSPSFWLQTLRFASPALNLPLTDVKRHLEASGSVPLKDLPSLNSLAVKLSHLPSHVFTSAVTTLSFEAPRAPTRRYSKSPLLLHLHKRLLTKLSKLRAPKSCTLKCLNTVIPW